MQLLERFIQLIASTMTIITFIFSINQIFFSESITMPTYFNGPLSITRLLIAGILVLSCNYIISYPCSLLLQGKFNKSTRYVSYGILVFISAWANFFIVKEILFGKALYYNGSFKLGYAILMIIVAGVFMSFTSKHLHQKEYDNQELGNDLLALVCVIYVIIGFITIVYNPSGFNF